MNNLYWGFWKTFFAGAIPLSIFFWLLLCHTLILWCSVGIVVFIVISLMLGTTIEDWRNDTL